MNSRERQIQWLYALDNHAGVCSTCREDADVCSEWINLVHSYNTAAPIDFDDIPDNVARTER
jgi:hypothetical protein